MVSWTLVTLAVGMAGRPMVMVSARIALSIGVPASAACTVKAKEPAVEGVPLIVVLMGPAEAIWAGRPTQSAN